MREYQLRKQQQEDELKQLWEDPDDGLPYPYILARGDIIWMDRDTLQKIGSKHIRLMNGYPAVTWGGRPRKLHHLVMNVTGKTLNGNVVDHINRNPRDARRANLRICTPAENALNTHRTSEYILTPLEVRMAATEAFYRRVVIQCMPKNNN